jgi:hypothetical protein
MATFNRGTTPIIISPEDWVTITAGQNTSGLITIAGEAVTQAIASRQKYNYGGYSKVREVVITVNAGSVEVNLSQDGAVPLDVATAQARIDGEVWVTDPEFGGIGDGTTDNFSAISAAKTAANGGFFNIPVGTYYYSGADSTLDVRAQGRGQIKTGSNKHAPNVSYVASAPSSAGDESSVLTAFNGDLSKVFIPIEHRITGAATLGQPTSGYKYTPEAYAIYGYLFNQSGYNHSTTTNEGRTAAAFSRVKVFQAGQGDAVAYNASAFVTGAKAGAISFLANPAASLLNGDIGAGQAGVYLNPFEVMMQDNGYDVAAVGWVVNSARTVSTGSLDVFWAGYLSQSKGTAQIDAHFSGNGKARIGLDLVGTVFDSEKIAVAIKANDRIYLDCQNLLATSYPDGVQATSQTYIDYDASGGIRLVQGGVAALQVKSNQVTVNTANGLSLASTGIIRFVGSGQFGVGTSSATFTATNKPGATTGQGPSQWLKVNLNGSEQYIPTWAA